MTTSQRDPYAWMRAADDRRRHAGHDEDLAAELGEELRDGGEPR